MLNLSRLRIRGNMGSLKEVKMTGYEIYFVDFKRKYMKISPVRYS